MLLPASMRHNSKGDHVREIQTRLNQNGAGLSVDGVFGPRTDAAVRAFQSRRRLTVDGIVGPNTWAALSGSGGGNPPPANSASAEAIIRRARGEMGVAEDPRGSNRTKYGTWYGMNGQPWCAIFVSWVFFQEGMPLSFSTQKGFSYTPSGVAGFKSRGQWKTSSPRPGDVVFFNFGGGRVNHVGIVESVNGDGSVNTIEGNSSDRVSPRRQRSEIAGYGRPNYR